MHADEIWTHIHAERTAMAETLSTLTAEQWSTPSWCAGWSVSEVAGHLVSSAEETPLHFYKELIGAGMRFSVFADRGAKRLGALTPTELIGRLRVRTTTTNHPPAPVIAMLGEVVVHGDDLRRPLGLQRQVPEAALRAVADNWKNSNILIGAKRRIAGLRLRATDVDWVHGDGPEVAGPLQSLVLAMTGRRGSHSDLSGDGVATLAARP